jgi:hypothetical protein
LKNGLFVRLIFIIDHFSSPSEVDYMLNLFFDFSLLHNNIA